MAAGLQPRDGYDATIERIRAQDGEISRPGKTALRWITCAEWPLCANQLCHTLEVKLGSTDPDIGNIPSMSTFVSCCQWLVMVDNEESTVRSIHFTLQQLVFTRKKNTLAGRVDKPLVMSPVHT